MKIAYFDCFSGISGDMVLGAFLDAGLKLSDLSRELGKLGVGGYSLKKARAVRQGIVGSRFECIRTKSYAGHRQVKEIIALIGKSSLHSRVKDTAKGIFNAIGSAEAKIHGVDKDDAIWLHELGDIDSIIDIVGAAIAVNLLGIDKIYFSRINMGRGYVRSSHGNLPIPAPAALELLKGVDVNLLDVDAELVTPTGAAIAKTLSEGFCALPPMKISRIGYGAGSKDIKKFPNMLRVLIGSSNEYFLKEDRILVVEANIDDMNPQYYEYIFERLFRAGALDVYSTAIQMKKARPAFKLTVLCNMGDVNDLSSIIFNETTTTGIRFYEAGRFKVERRIRRVKTKYGNVRVKICERPDGGLTIAPEYDDCRHIARSKKVPLREVSDEVRRAVDEKA